MAPYNFNPYQANDAYNVGAYGFMGSQNPKSVLNSAQNSNNGQANNPAQAFGNLADAWHQTLSGYMRPQAPGGFYGGQGGPAGGPPAYSSGPVDQRSILGGTYGGQQGAVGGQYGFSSGPVDQNSILGTGQIASTLPNQINQNAVPMPAQLNQSVSDLITPINQGATTLPNQIGRGGVPDTGGSNVPLSPGTLTPYGTIPGTAGLYGNSSPGIPQGNGLTAAPMSTGLTNQYTPTPKPGLGPPAIPGGENQNTNNLIQPIPTPKPKLGPPAIPGGENQNANGLITPIGGYQGQNGTVGGAVGASGPADQNSIANSVNNLIQRVPGNYTGQNGPTGLTAGTSTGPADLASVLGGMPQMKGSPVSRTFTGNNGPVGGVAGTSGPADQNSVVGGNLNLGSKNTLNPGQTSGSGSYLGNGQTWNSMVQNWQNSSDKDLQDQGWSDAQIKWLRNGASGAMPNGGAGDQSSSSSSSSSSTTTPGTPAPAAPGNDVQSAIHQLLSPAFQQQQKDLMRQMNAQAAQTGDINAGTYNTEKLGTAMSRLVGQQGQTEAQDLFQANQSQQDRQNQLALENIRSQTSKYAADVQASAMRAGASAQQAAAMAQVEASKYESNLRYQLGLAQVNQQDVNSQRNYDLGVIGNNANIYGIDTQNQFNLLSLLYNMSPQFSLNNAFNFAGLPTNVGYQP